MDMGLLRDTFIRGAREGVFRDAFNRIFSRRSVPPRSGSPNHPAGLQSLLERTYRGLRPESPLLPGVLADLIDGLRRARSTCPAEQWRSTAELIQRHSVTAAIHLDPLTHRWFHKPRGYAADPIMVDLVYRDCIPAAESPVPGALGARIWDFTSAMPFACAIRNRRDTIVRRLDAAAESVHAAEVLVIEAGHLREAHLSNAVKDRAFRRFVALDRDGQASAAVRREFGRHGVTAIHTPSYALLGGTPNALGNFDLIYSAGLFDGLETQPARRALAAMFSMVKPGGKLLIANLRPYIHDAAYIQTFMNWWPNYRDDAALSQLAADIPAAETVSRNIIPEPTGAIGFLELVRAG